MCECVCAPVLLLILRCGATQMRESLTADRPVPKEGSKEGRAAITGVLPSDLMGWTRFMKRFLTPAFARGAIKYPMLDMLRGHTL